MTRIGALAATLALVPLLAGCSLFGQPPPDVVLVTQEAAPPHLPSECNAKGDPAYKPQPDSALSKTTLVRQDAENARVIDTLKSKRATCWNGLQAQQKG